MRRKHGMKTGKNDRRDRDMVLTVISRKILTGNGWARALFFRQQLLDCRGALDAGFPFYACVLSTLPKKNRIPSGDFRVLSVGVTYIQEIVPYGV